MLFSIFKKFPQLLIVLSEKRNGPMKFSRENRERFLRKLRINPARVAIAGLIHGNKVKIVNERDTGKIIPKTDGLITNKRIYLAITTADCLPIFIYDPKRKVFAIIHGGWKSLAKGILAVTIEKFVKDFKSRPKDILVGMGPGICKNHYEINSKIKKKFKGSPQAIFIKKRKRFLDLKKVAKSQLLFLGLKDKNIEINKQCTFSSKKKYFSWRRERPKPLKAMLALIGRK